MTTSAPQSQTQPPSLEEEAIKRNTDCVYFLASPLTCKKGSECDYRHSDVARLNPRDCWYWLNSNCLNPKCAFRHPPLDGLLGAQTPASTGPSASNPRPATTAVYHAPNSGTVPCVFFKKGHCMKGDWCPFLHVPSPSGVKPLPVPGTTLASEPTTIKAGSSGLPKKMLEKNVSPVPAAKPISGTPQVTAANGESAPLRNAFSVSDFNYSLGSQPSRALPNGNAFGMSGRAQQTHRLAEPEGMHNKDLEEVSREPSPGFDVLVDDDGRDSDYYTGEDRYGMSGEHELRNELDIGHSGDYYMVAGIDDERYQDSLGYEPRQGSHHASELQQLLNGRVSGGSYYDGNNQTVSQIDELDLRHRLTKQKKSNGLRSVISRERSYEQDTSFRDNFHVGRLRGRIGLPRRSPSPRPYLHGRMGDMIMPGIEEPFRRDAASLPDDNGDFPAPKSLAELKYGKKAGSDPQYGKRKRAIIDGQQHQLGGSDLSFQPPKSLDEILKRKRGESNGMITSDPSLASNEAVTNEATDSETKSVAVSKGEEDNQKPGASDVSILNNVEDDVLVEDDAVEPEPEDEAYEHQGNGEDYDLETYEDPNGDPVGGEYGDDRNAEDDDDDAEFARKMGVVYS